MQPEASRAAARDTQGCSLSHIGLQPEPSLVSTWQAATYSAVYLLHLGLLLVLPFVMEMWLEFDLRRRGVGLSHVLQLMDGNRSGRATLNGFCQGLETANVDLTREQYVRLFKAIDTNGDRHITLADLRNTLQRPDAPGTPGGAGAGAGKGTGTPKNPFPVSARKATRRGEVKESHGGPRPFPPPRSSNGGASSAGTCSPASRAGPSPATSSSTEIPSAIAAASIRTISSWIFRAGSNSSWV